MINLIGGIAVFFGLIFYRAFVVVLGWGWFVVPLGVKDIGYVHALGLSLFIAMLTHENNDVKSKPFGELALEGAARLTLFLLFMWAYAQFM